jgi:hypothetical protein
MFRFVNETGNQIAARVGPSQSRIQVLPSSVSKFDESEMGSIEENLFNLFLQDPMLDRELL